MRDIIIMGFDDAFERPLLGATKSEKGGGGPPPAIPFLLQGLGVYLGLVLSIVCVFHLDRHFLMTGSTTESVAENGNSATTTDTSPPALECSLLLSAVCGFLLFVLALGYLFSFGIIVFLPSARYLRVEEDNDSKEQVVRRANHDEVAVDDAANADTVNDKGGGSGPGTQTYSYSSELGVVKFLRWFGFRFFSAVVGISMFYGSGTPLLMACGLVNFLPNAFHDPMLRVLFPVTCGLGECKGLWEDRAQQQAAAALANSTAAVAASGFEVPPPSGVTQGWVLTQFGPTYSTDSAFLFVAISIPAEIFLLQLVIPAPLRPRDSYSFADTTTSMLMFVLYALIPKIVLTGYNSWLYQDLFQRLHGTTPAAANVDTSGFFWFVHDLNSPLSLFLAWLSADLFYFIVHRWAHITAYLWNVHAVHHSTEEFNITLGPREGFLNWLTPYMLVFALPLALFFPAVFGVTMVSLISLFPVSVHTVLFPEGCSLKTAKRGFGKDGLVPCPWQSAMVGLLSQCINNPSLHRVHHARNHDRLGKNYGAMLSVWDKIFGTFQHEVIEAGEEEAPPKSSTISTTTPSDPLIPSHGEKQDAEQQSAAQDAFLRDSRDALYYGLVPVMKPRWGGPVWSNLHTWHHTLRVCPWNPVYGNRSVWGALWNHWTPVTPGARCPKLGTRLNPTQTSIQLKVANFDAAGSPSSSPPVGEASGAEVGASAAPDPVTSNPGSSSSSSSFLPGEKQQRSSDAALAEKKWLLVLTVYIAVQAIQVLGMGFFALAKDWDLAADFVLGEGAAGEKNTWENVWSNAIVGFPIFGFFMLSVESVAQLLHLVVAPAARAPAEVLGDRQEGVAKTVNPKAKKEPTSSTITGIPLCRSGSLGLLSEASRHAIVVALAAFIFEFSLPVVLAYVSVQLALLIALGSAWVGKSQGGFGVLSGASKATVESGSSTCQKAGEQLDSQKKQAEEAKMLREDARMGA